MYLVLLGLGLGIGAVFLVVLLVGDWKEARREARNQAVQEQNVQAREPVEGEWPPPPSSDARSVPSALPSFSPYAVSSKPPVTQAANRKMVRNFFLVRNYASATLVSYILYSCFPQFSFGWVLPATALAIAAAWGVWTLFARSASRK